MALIDIYFISEKVGLVKFFLVFQKPQAHHLGEIHRTSAYILTPLFLKNYYGIKIYSV